MFFKRSMAELCLFNQVFYLYESVIGLIVLGLGISYCLIARHITLAVGYLPYAGFLLCSHRTGNRSSGWDESRPAVMRAHEAEAQVVVSVRWRVVVTIGRTTVPRVVVPATATFNPVRTPLCLNSAFLVIHHPSHQYRY